jgi:hypothetical protein
MPSRIVHQTDAVAWLGQQTLPEDHALVTSLPDSSELNLAFDAWQRWFSETAELVCRATAERAVSIFFQTDVKRDGRWIDKSFLVQLGAQRAGSHLLWHKVVCRAPAGVTTFGRPSYAHLLCFSRGLQLESAQSSPDVLPQLGHMTWSRAMGTAACAATCEFLIAHTACRTVVDPFCGVGSMLAVANAYGLDAIGVERSQKRAERARTLTLRRMGDERSQEDAKARS